MASHLFEYGKKSKWTHTHTHTYPTADTPSHTKTCTDTKSVRSIDSYRRCDDYGKMNTLIRHQFRLNVSRTNISVKWVALGCRRSGLGRLELFSALAICHNFIIINEFSSLFFLHISIGMFTLAIRFVCSVLVERLLLSVCSFTATRFLFKIFICSLCTLRCTHTVHEPMNTHK